MNSFRAAIEGNKLAITAELTLKRSSTAGEIRRQADLLAPYVDGIQVSDSPYAWVQMSALSAAGILTAHGVDAVPILTCRDRNRTALRNDLRGLRALGVSSVILTRGPRIPKNHAVKASTVFDLSGRELIALAASMQEKPHPNGESDKLAAAGGVGESGFFIGTAARVFRPRTNWRADSLRARAAVGARFMQTQLCLNSKILRIYMDRFVEAELNRDYRVVVTLTPLPSAVTAQWLKDTMKDSHIPPAIIKRLESAADPEQEGILICAEVMREVAEIPGVAAINLMTTGNSESILAAIEASGLRTDHDAET